MRTIYIHPGEQVRVRFVPEGYDKNATEWNFFGNQRQMLLTLSHNHVKFTDPMISVTRKDLFSGEETPYNPTPERNSEKS